MKITVSTEKEKELVKKFIEELHDSCILEDLNDDVIRVVVDDTDVEFVMNGLREAVVEVGETSSLMHDDDIVIGVCVVCGDETHGTIDGDDIDDDEWQEYCSEITRNQWKCSKCYELDQEV